MSDALVPAVIGKPVSMSRAFIWDFKTVKEILAGATIASVVVTVVNQDGGLTLTGSPTISGSQVRVFVSAGTLGVTYVLKCAATLSGSPVPVIPGWGYVEIIPDPS